MHQRLPWLSLLLATTLVAEETPIHLLYGPALSPDGSTLVFEWDDDLWQAPTTSGEASLVLSTPGRDMFPRITPDGKRIVFTTDQNGFPQVASRAITGGEISYHSTHTEGSQLECLSPDGTRALVRGLRDRSGYKPWRLMEIDITRPSGESQLFDASAHSPAWSPDGSRVLFCRGGELPYRRGFHGSRASRIWSYQRKTKTFTCEVPGDFEARSPLWLPDGSSFLFVSNQSGTANLWKKSGNNPPVQLTHHSDEEVLTPGLSHDGSTLLYRHGLDLIKINPATPGKPQTLRLFTREKLVDRSTETIKVKGCLHADLCTTTRQIAFSEAGELWLSSAGKTETLRLTDSSAAEEWPLFLPGSGVLFYVSDDGIESRIVKAQLSKDQIHFPTTIHSCPSSISSLTTSPDGSRIAWIEARGDIRIADTKGSHIRTIFPCWDKPTYTWSPDGRWLAIAAEDANANRDIYLVSTTTDAPPINLTRHPAFDGSPIWSPDGKRLVFTSKRGESGKAALWCIEWTGNFFGPHRSNKPSPTAAELQSQADKAKSLSTLGLEPRRTIWTKNPDEFLFQSRNSKNEKIYQFDFDYMRASSHCSSNGIPIRTYPDGTTLFRVNRIPTLFKNRTFTRLEINTSFTRKREDFLRLGFRRIWRTLGERFHDPDMNGRDWAAIRTKYEDHAARARTSREFDHIIGRLMGELNASHMVFQRKPWIGESKPKPPSNQTLHPGIRFHHPTGGPLRIASILPGSPVSHIESPPAPGDVVTRIAAQEVNDATALEPFFMGAPGLRIPITLKNPTGQTRTITAECITYAKARELDARAERDLAAARCAEHPGIAYIHLPNMSRDSLETFRLAVHRAAAGSQALILDLRANGGGREANRMLAILHPTIPFTTTPRDGHAGYPHDRLPDVPWPHPIAVLCNENTYSNAEIFCHAYLAAKRGPLIGTPTAGGVISAVMTDIPGLGKLQIPFRTWRKPDTEASLDLNGAQPNHAIDHTPADEHQQRDPQLEAALKLLDP